MSDSGLKEYKKRVLEVAEAVRVEEDWCIDGFEEALRKLDLFDRWNTVEARMHRAPAGTIVMQASRTEMMIKYPDWWRIVNAAQGWAYSAPGDALDQFKRLLNDQYDETQLLIGKLYETGDSEGYPLLFDDWSGDE